MILQGLNPNVEIEQSNTIIIYLPSNMHAKCADTSCQEKGFLLDPRIFPATKDPQTNLAPMAILKISCLQMFVHFVALEDSSNIRSEVISGSLTLTA